MTNPRGTISDFCLKLTDLSLTLLSLGAVIVFRKINSDMAEVKLLNLKSVRRTSDLENDLTLQAGDMVFVPRDRISKIERFMKLASVAAFMAPRL